MLEANDATLQAVDEIVTENMLPAVSPADMGGFGFNTFNPFTADVQIHGCQVLFHRLTGKTCLPDGFEEMTQYGEIPFDSLFRTRIREISRSGDQRFVDCETFSETGRLLMRIKSASWTLSRTVTKLIENNFYDPSGMAN